MVALRTDSYDLSRLRLTAGEGRRLDLDVSIEPFELGGERYAVEPALVAVRVDVSRTTGDGYALRLHLTATLAGPCMRCLQPAKPSLDVDSREVFQPGDIEELRSPYVEHGSLDVRAWVSDALALALPSQLLCRDDCAGLCAICGADLGAAGAAHGHEPEPDPRWSKLSELRFD